MPAVRWAAKTFPRFGENSNKVNKTPPLRASIVEEGVDRWHVSASERDQKGEAKKLRCHFVKGVASTACRRGTKTGPHWLGGNQERAEASFRGGCPRALSRATWLELRKAAGQWVRLYSALMRM